MTLRYGDRHPREEPTPECFGREAYYSMGDEECRNCDFAYQCKKEINDRKPTPVERYSARRNEGYQPQSRNMVSSSHAGVVLEGETAFERFAKDCVTGACRGFFEEGSDFFRNWRW